MAADSISSMQSCNSVYVMLFDKDEVTIANRCTPVKSYEVGSGSSLKCASLIPDEPVKFPPKPTAGMLNPSFRETLLKEYAKNPLVFTADTNAAVLVEDTSTSASRHFLGFGFSKDTPYYPPGTVVKFNDMEVTISGMVVAYGQRANEYAVILSFNKSVHPDAACAFLDSYNLTEIDNGDDGLCACLANIIQKCVSHK